MEYGLHWVHKNGVCIGHVYFMLFVSISFALGSQHKRNFEWNMNISSNESDTNMGEFETARDTMVDISGTIKKIYESK